MINFIEVLLKGKNKTLVRILGGCQHRTTLLVKYWGSRPLQPLRRWRLWLTGCSLLCLDRWSGRQIFEVLIRRQSCLSCRFTVVWPLVGVFLSEVQVSVSNFFIPWPNPVRCFTFHTYCLLYIRAWRCFCCKRKNEGNVISGICSFCETPDS